MLELWRQQKKQNNTKQPTSSTVNKPVSHSNSSTFTLISKPSAPAPKTLASTTLRPSIHKKERETTVPPRTISSKPTDSVSSSIPSSSSSSSSYSSTSSVSKSVVNNSVMLNGTNVSSIGNTSSDTSVISGSTAKLSQAEKYLLWKQQKEQESKRKSIAPTTSTSSIATKPTGLGGSGVGSGSGLGSELRSAKRGNVASNNTTKMNVTSMTTQQIQTLPRNKVDEAFFFSSCLFDKSLLDKKAFEAMVLFLKKRKKTKNFNSNFFFFEF